MPVNTSHFNKKRKTQKFKYFLVLDFEATCDEVYFPEMEIIEFPCLKVDSNTFNVISTFHRYVRPVRHPILTPFCSNLTGITQDMVKNELSFPEVLDQFLHWLIDNQIILGGPACNAAFVTCGDWDLQKMLPSQCSISGIPIPPGMRAWINVKQSFVKSTGLYPHGIKDMLSQLKLKHVGALHSGIDDCRNIVKIVRGIAERGYIHEITKTLEQ